jgi:hypothetical protein
MKYESHIKTQENRATTPIELEVSLCKACELIHSFENALKMVAKIKAMRSSTDAYMANTFVL